MDEKSTKQTSNLEIEPGDLIVYDSIDKKFCGLVLRSYRKNNRDYWTVHWSDTGIQPRVDAQSTKSILKTDGWTLQKCKCKKK